MSGITRKAVDRAAVVARLEMPKEIAADGIVLAQVGQEHAPAYAALYGDPSSQYIGGPVDAHGAWQRLAMDAGHWRIFGFGRYGIFDAHREFLGYAGLWFPHDKPEVEIAYGLMPHARGKGIATRAVRLVAMVAERRGVPSLVSYIAPDNEASKRVAQSAGAAFQGFMTMDGSPHEVWRYPVDPQDVEGDPVLLEATVMPLNIRTERLSLTQWRSEHIERYAAFVADETCMRFMGGPGTLYNAARGMLVIAGHWALRGYGFYAVEYDGHFVGLVGLVRPPGTTETELAYHLMPDAWGQGFATEAAKAVRWAAAEQGLTTLMSAVHPQNERSLKVVERLGAVADGTVMNEGAEAIRFVHPLERGGPAPQTEPSPPSKAMSA